jgi:membrane associated rhomboid family serine protease
LTVHRARRGNDLSRALTFGGRVPPALGLLLVLIFVSTVAAWLTGTRSVAALVPARLIGGELWRLVSWAFVQNDPLTLLFGGLMLYFLGMQLAFTWSERRLVGTFLGLAVGASLATVLVGIVWRPGLGLGHLGMWPVVNGLLLMWAMLNPHQQVNIWGVLPLTGRMLALLVVFGTFLYGLAAGGMVGLATFTPHFAALLIGWALGRGKLPTRRWRLQLREWWAERAFRRRSRHLKVIRKNGKDEPPRWMN